MSKGGSEAPMIACPPFSLPRFLVASPGNLRLLAVAEGFQR